MLISHSGACAHIAGPADRGGGAALSSQPAPLHRQLAHPPRQQRQRRAPHAPAARSAFADETATGQGRRRRGPPPLLERTGELAALLQEIGAAALASGPAGFNRAFQAAQAVASVAVEYASDLQRGVVPPPPRVLRLLFERLGTTYIKLGQV